MKKSLIILTFITTLMACNDEKKQTIVDKYIEYANTNNIIDMDSLISQDFKFYSGKNISDKTDFIKPIDNKFVVTHFKRNIINQEKTDSIFKIKLEMTDDFITNLGLEPFYREQEFHINKDNKICLIYTLKESAPKNYTAKINMFYQWANDNYKVIYDKMIELSENGENFGNELNFLFAKLKSEGIDVLDKYKTKDIDNNSSNIKIRSISTVDFSKSLIGKSKTQIKEMYGKPCYTQDITGYIFWYYGSLHCDESYVTIINEDTGASVPQAQIQFSGDIAIAVNYL
jgi:hypothetical protein